MKLSQISAAAQLPSHQGSTSAACSHLGSVKERDGKFPLRHKEHTKTEGKTKGTGPRREARSRVCLFGGPEGPSQETLQPRQQKLRGREGGWLGSSGGSEASAHVDPVGVVVPKAALHLGHLRCRVS